MNDRLSREIDRIDHHGQFGWRDRDGEGFTRNILLGLRYQGLLDRGTLVAEMANRGHGPTAIKQLNRFIDKTYEEPDRGSGY